MEVDFKIKAWERILIPEEIEDEVRELIEKKAIQNSQQLYDLYPHYELQWEFLSGTEEQMTEEENNGDPVIEIVNEDAAVKILAFNVDS